MMTYTVTFIATAGEEGFSMFATLQDAREFVTSRPADYGTDFVITERSEDGGHEAIVK